MTKLNDRPVRPRSRSAQPSYPRKLSLGAVALMTAVASTAVGCANIVETAEGDEASDEPSWIWELPDPYENNNNSTGGEYAGGIGEEWTEGGGGAGGDEAGGGGAGGDEAGGQGQGGDLGS